TGVPGHREECRSGVPGDRKERRSGVPGDRKERRSGVTGDRGITVDLRDTGLGIPPGVAERMFEPWVTSKPGRGTGLGLSITRDVVQRAGGTIELVPSPGPGTTFRVSLPVHRPVRRSPGGGGSFSEGG